MNDTQPLLSVRNLRKEFPIRKGVFARQVGAVKAVNDVSFDVARGETLGVVGESGCGKTTTGRAILRLIEPTSGEVRFEGRDVRSMGTAELRALRREMQIIFQDPWGSLNPRMRIGTIVREPLDIHKVGANRAERNAMVDRLLERVGLDPSMRDRYPHEISGGQRQRIGVARAIALRPKLIVADEPVSALDVSVQAQVINLMVDLQAEYGCAYLFIAHDLALVERIADRVAVMYLGRIVESGPTAELFRNPLHPYTKALLQAIPVPEPGRPRERAILEGEIPSPTDPPPGCRFHTRCPVAIDVCRRDDPRLREVVSGRRVACHLVPDGPGTEVSGTPKA